MTGPDHDAPQDLAAAYALGALSADEARRFEAVLATSPEAQREVAEYREVAALLALSGAEAPGDALRARVMARVGEQKTRVLPPAEAAASPAPADRELGGLDETRRCAPGPRCSPRGGVLSRTQAD